MKKITTLIPAFMICCSLAMATAETVSTAAPIEQPVEPTRIEQSSEALSDQAQNVWDALLGFTEEASSFMNSTIDSAKAWTDGALSDAQAVIGDKLELLSDWIYRADETFNSASEAVKSAWDTLKDGAEQVGKYTQEEIDAAYATVQEWLQTTEDTVDSAVREAVDGVAAAAGAQTQE